MKQLICLVGYLFLFAMSAVADDESFSPEPRPQGEVPGKALVCGTACTVDPQCVVVGDSHMLVWKSSMPGGIVVVCIHGLGFCAKAYKALSEKLTAAGIDGYGVNVRGFGPDRNNSQYARLNCVKTVSDVCELLTNIRKAYPDHRVFLLGESMGGALAVRIAAENPALIDGVVCSAPAWKILRVKRTAFRGVVELVLSPRRPGPASRAIMHQATDNPALMEHLVSDPSHKLKLSVQEALSFLHFISRTDSYAKRLEKPVLVIQGLQDHLVSPEAVARLFGDIRISNKKLLIDAKGEHLLLEEGGFSPAVLASLLFWLKSTPADTLKAPVVEIVNNSDLSADDKRQLLRLRHLAGQQLQGSVK